MAFQPYKILFLRDKEIRQIRASGGWQSRASSLYRRYLWSILLYGVASAAWADCTPLRIAYLDQNRPPYFLGDGREIPDPPGASVELLQAITASLPCKPVFLRLPLRRLRTSLEAGEVDAVPLDVVGNEAEIYALPLDKQGQLDRSRAISIATVVFVRSADNLPKDTDPRDYFRTHRLGMALNAPQVAQAREAGLDIDDGTLDTILNFDKLRLRRTDGVATLVIDPADFDNFLAKRYGDTFVRLDKPLRQNHIWLAFSKTWHASHRAEAETMWNWIGMHGPSTIARLARKYGAGS